MENRITATLTPNERDAVLQLIAEIRAKLPFLINLTPEERASMVRMGDKSRPFVEQCLVLAERDDSFMPRSFETAEMRKDMELYEMAQPIILEAVRLLDSLQDTSALIGSDLMMASLEVYRNAKANGRGAGLDTIAPLLGRRFARKGGAKSGEPDAPTP